MRNIPLSSLALMLLAGAVNMLAESTYPANPTAFSNPQNSVLYCKFMADLTVGSRVGFSRSFDCRPASVPSNVATSGVDLWGYSFKVRGIDASAMRTSDASGASFGVAQVVEWEIAGDRANERLIGKSMCQIGMSKDSSIVSSPDDMKSPISIPVNRRLPHPTLCNRIDHDEFLESDLKRNSLATDLLTVRAISGFRYSGTVHCDPPEIVMTRPAGRSNALAGLFYSTPEVASSTKA